MRRDELRSPSASLEERDECAVMEDALSTLSVAAAWEPEHSKHVRRQLWRAFDAPSSTGRISVPDVDRWLRSKLGSACESIGSRPTAQRLFEAANEQRSARTQPQHMEPGAAFWRLLLLLLCYMRLLVTFRPPVAERPLGYEVLLGVGSYLERWGTPELSVESAREEFGRLDRTRVGHVRFDEVCDWAMLRLLSHTDSFQELERAVLTAPSDMPPATQPARVPTTPIAKPLALL